MKFPEGGGTFLRDVFLVVEPAVRADNQIPEIGRRA
jgi:hypothetical protein